MKRLPIILALLLASCTTLESWQANPKVQFAEAEAVKLAASYFSNGGSVNSAWGISSGLNMIGDVTAFVQQQKTTSNPNVAASLTINQTVRDFAANPTAVSGLANGLASVIGKVDPQSPQERAQVVLALAQGVQTAAASLVQTK